MSLLTYEIGGSAAPALSVPREAIRARSDYSTPKRSFRQVPRGRRQIREARPSLLSSVPEAPELASSSSATSDSTDPAQPPLEPTIESNDRVQENETEEEQTEDCPEDDDDDGLYVPE